MTELERIRRDIDVVDDKIAALFVERMALAKQIAVEKAKKGAPTVDSKRENEIIARITASVPSDLGKYARAVFEALMGASKAYQEDFLKGEDGK